MPKSKKILAVLVVGFMLSMSVVVFTGCDGDEDTKSLTFGSSNFSEPWILVEIAKVLLEDEGFEIEHIRNFQGASVEHEAMVAGDTDLYMSWTGTQFTGILGKEVTDEWMDRDKVYDYVKEQFAQEYDQTWSPPLGFNNTYAIAVREDFAEEHNLETVSDLRDMADDLSIGMDTTFMDRAGDGYSDFLEHYDIEEFGWADSMEYGILYRAVAEGDIDVGVAYSTDGRIVAMDLTILEDDREFFPPYDGALVMCNDMLEEYPEIEDTLSVMWGAFDEETMGALNAEVDVEEREYDEVAREFVEEMGWID